MDMENTVFSKTPEDDVKDDADHMSHLPWRPVNLDMSAQRQFHFPRALFTCLMKNWGVSEIIAGELLHSGQNFRGI